MLSCLFLFFIIKLEKMESSDRRQTHIIDDGLKEELFGLLESKKQNRALELNRFGKRHGFLDSSMRSSAYMILLDIREVDLDTNQIGLSVDMGIEDDEVIVNDAIRSFLGYKELAGLSQEDLKKKRKDLSHILHYFFKRHRCFSYYQGLNSFGELFLITFGKSLGYLILEKYSLNYLRKYLTNQDFESEVKNQISITLHILEKEVPEYREIFGIGENGEGAQEKLGFIVSWIVTWFSYRMKNIELIFRTFDYLMCSPPHIISILVSLVIKEIIRSNNISMKSDEEVVFSSFYNSNLDQIQWNRLYEQCDILYSTEYSSGIISPSNMIINKILGSFKFGKKGKESKNNSGNKGKVKDSGNTGPFSFIQKSGASLITKVNNLGNKIFSKL